MKTCIIKCLLLCAILCKPILLHAQNYEYHTAPLLFTFSTEPRHIAADTSGNIFNAGTDEYFVGTGFFEGYIRIQKFDKYGHELWVKSIGPTVEWATIANITTDKTGNIYLTGNFMNNVDFDPGPSAYNIGSYHTSTGASGGSYQPDIYILKLDNNGNFIWVKQIQNTTNSTTPNPKDISVNDNGDIFISGNFYFSNGQTMDFDIGPGIANNPYHRGFFIEKLNNSGSFKWVKFFSVTGADYDIGKQTLDDSSNVIFTGWFTGTLDADPGVNTNNLTAVGSRDCITGKIDSAGNMKWAVQTASFNTELEEVVSTDILGNVYTMGQFVHTVDFDPGVNADYLTARNVGDHFIRKLNADGKYQWSRLLQDVKAEHTDFISDHNGNIYITGRFIDSLDFDPTSGINMVYSPNKYQGFVQKLNTSGNLINVKLFDDLVFSPLYVDRKNNLYIKAYVKGLTDMDPDSGVSIAREGESVIVKFTPNPNPCKVSITPSGRILACAGPPFKYLYADTSAGSTYQWYKNGQLLIGATGPSLQYNAVTIGSCALSVMATKGCGTVLSNTVWVNNTSSYSPPVYSYSSLSFCPPGYVQLKCPDSATTYQWRKNTINISGATSSSYIADTAGSYTVQVGDNSCLANSSSVTVNSTSSVNFTIRAEGSTTFCFGSVKLYIDYPVAGYSYQWQNNGVNIPGQTNNSIVVTTSGNYACRVSASCGTDTSNVITVNANASSNPSISVLGNSNLCATSQVNPFNVSTTNSNIIYNWTVPSGATIISGQGTDGIIVAFSSNAISGNICATSNFCGNVIQKCNSITVSSVDSIIVANGPVTFCNGNVNLVAVAALNTTYQWKMNGSDIPGAITNILTVSISGNYSCLISNACTSKLSNSITVTNGIAPTLSALLGTIGFCRSSTGNIYNASPAQPVVTYNWTLPTGATITNGQGTSTITVSFASNAVSGNVCVTASSSCGSSPTVCKAITLRTTLPSTPGTITGSNNGCPSESKLYTIRKISNADSYLWTPPIGATINGSSAVFSTVDTFVTVTFTPTFTGDTLRVKSVNCVGTGTTERKLRINKNAPSTPGTITGTTTGLCNQTGKIYSINAVTNALTYTWRTNIVGLTINGSTMPVTTGNAVTLNFSSFISGQLYVKANNNCGSSTERALTIYARPAVPASITGPSSVCDGDTGSYSTVAVANASAYNWTTLSGSTIISGQGTTAANIKFGNVATSGLVRVRAQNSCASSAYVTKSVTVNICPRMLDASEQSQLTIQPNPFSNSTTIILPDDADLPNSALIIFDVFGKEVRRIEPQDYNLLFDKENLSSGIYLLKWITGNEMISSVKMMIE